MDNPYENSYKYFENRACKYYPCHAGKEHINCLFCFCPFYLREACPGKPHFVEKSDRIVKDCTNCAYPHEPEHYEVLMNWLKKANQPGMPSQEIWKRAMERRQHD